MNFKEQLEKDKQEDVNNRFKNLLFELNYLFRRQKTDALRLPLYIDYGDYGPFFNIGVPPKSWHNALKQEGLEIEPIFETKRKYGIFGGPTIKYDTGEVLIRIVK